MTPTNHFSKRVKERLGVHKRSVTRLLEKAIKNGFSINETKKYEDLYGYLSNKIMDNNSDIILYNRYVYIYNSVENIAITIISLPYKYHKYEDIMKRERSEQIGISQLGKS